MRYKNFGFFDINECSKKFRATLENDRVRCYVDHHSGVAMCYPQIHTVGKKTTDETLLNKIYQAESKKYIAEYGYDFVGSGKEQEKRRDERIKNIKDILQQSIKKNKQLAEELEKNYQSDLDAFLDKKEYSVSKGLFDRQKRFYRKGYFNRGYFNGFWTVTFDPKKFESVEAWLKSLLWWFANNAVRKDLKVMGAVEYGDENGRIHFHCLGHFPESFLDDLVTFKAYSTKRKKWEIRTGNAEVREKFGINDFQDLRGISDEEYNKCMHYICDYVLKQNGKIYYGRGIKDYCLTFVDFDKCSFQVDDGIVKYLIDDNMIPNKDTWFPYKDKYKATQLKFHIPD